MNTPINGGGPAFPVPTPAALRAVMKELYLRDHADDYALADDPRDDSEILRDHIRALAAEMRATIPRNDTDLTMCGMLIRDLLNGFADKLEGKA